MILVESNDLEKVDCLQGSTITFKDADVTCPPTATRQSIWMETPDTRSRATLGEKMDRQQGQKTQAQNPFASSSLNEVSELTRTRRGKRSLGRAGALQRCALPPHPPALRRSRW